MDTFVKFFLLGFGAGGAYALLAIGIVLIYRGSGVVNFAHGAIGLFGVAFFYELRRPVGSAGAVVAGVLASAVLGVVIQVLIMRPMRRASPLMRVVATLAILAVIQEGAVIKYGDNVLFVNAFLPHSAVRFSPTVVVGEDRLIILAITVALTLVLWLVYKRTRFGLATTAAAENERAAASLGWSPNSLALVNWAAGGALAGLAGTLLVPITGLSPDALTLAVVPALAASLLGGFSSFPLTLIGGLLIGITESETTNYVSTPGWSAAVPFIAIIAILLVRGRALPLRGHLAERLPRLGSGDFNWLGLVVGAVVVGLSLALFTASWSAAMMVAGVYGFIALSLVVLVGYAGQLSLAQFGLAGLGALIASRLADAGHVPDLLAMLIGVILTVPIGALVALPAVRIRGVSLSVVTLGLAVVVSGVILSNPNYTGGVIRGTVVPSPGIAGFSLDPVAHPARYAGFGIVLFIIATCMVSNLRRGRSGRRLIAVRNNERAAASLGVSVSGAKLYAFAFSAGLAATGGILLAFQNTNVTFGQFDVLTSVNVILIAVIGGIGYIGGAIFSGFGANQGPFQEFISHKVSSGNWYLLIAGLLTIVALIANPDGLARAQADQIAWIKSKLGRPRRVHEWDMDSGQEESKRVKPSTLTVENLSVHFGGVTALSGVSLTVAPGRVVGLIGPNGAGKTTLIDAVTGFVRGYDGRIAIDGVAVDQLTAVRRARRGLTRSFQSLELFEDLSVADNLRTASDDRDILAYGSDLVAPGRPALSPQAKVAIREFALEPYLNKLPAELPYAQRRLVAIARAVAAGPSILLLDEPAAGLDTNSTAELARLVRRLADDWGMSILLIEHDVAMVLGVCDDIVVLNFGQTLASGKPADISRDPKVIEAYLGDIPDGEGAAVPEDGPADQVNPEIRAR